MLLPSDPQICMKNYRIYSDTVTILSALYDLFAKNRQIGKYVGIELKLKNNLGDQIEPDLITLYENDTKGLLFELKWSLPENPEYLQKEIKELSRYFNEFTNWRNATGKVNSQDLVLICNINDVNHLVRMVQILCKNENYTFLESDHFSIWGWDIIPSKRGEKEEELRISRFYGKTENQNLERILDEPAGMLIHKRVLQYLRWQFSFIKQKPPIQYTIIMLIQQILGAFPAENGTKSYEVHTDNIYQRSKIFFPSWQQYDKQTIQLKRNWVTEALNLMADLEIISRKGEDMWKLPYPIFRTRSPIQEALCKKIVKFREESLKAESRKPSKILLRQKPVKYGPLDQLFKKVQE